MRAWRDTLFDEAMDAIDERLLFESETEIHALNPQEPVRDAILGNAP
jgi:hypothetical protein